MLFSFATRRTVDLDVLRDRNPDFVTLADGAVRNGYTLKLMNRNDESRMFDLTVGGLQAREIKIIGLGKVAAAGAFARRSGQGAHRASADHGGTDARFAGRLPARSLHPE